MDDVLDNLRQKSIFDINDVKNAVVETNGKISVQKNDGKTAFTVPVITDGQRENEYYGNNKIEKDVIDCAVKKMKVKENEIMLMTLDENGNISIIKKDKNI